MTDKKAREAMAKALRDDPDLRRAYRDNIACLIMDRIPGFKRKKIERDEIAEAILGLIFD